MDTSLRDRKKELVWIVRLIRTDATSGKPRRSNAVKKLHIGGVSMSAVELYLFRHFCSTRSRLPELGLYSPDLGYKWKTRYKAIGTVYRALQQTAFTNLNHEVTR